MVKPNLFERLYPLLGILILAIMLCITEINKHKKLCGLKINIHDV